MREEDLFSAEARIVKDTGKCFLIDVEGESVLIPKSQIHDDSEVFDMDNREGRLVIPMWLAVDRGIA